RSLHRHAATSCDRTTHAPATARSLSALGSARRANDDHGKRPESPIHARSAEARTSFTAIRSPCRVELNTGRSRPSVSPRRSWPRDNEKLFLRPAPASEMSSGRPRRPPQLARGGLIQKPAHDGLERLSHAAVRLRGRVEVILQERGLHAAP